MFLSTVLQYCFWFKITNGGSILYCNHQVVGLSAGGSNSATAKVQTITGSIDEIIIDDVGLDYAVGDNLIFNNGNTNGTGAVCTSFSCWWWYCTRSFEV